MKVYLGLPTYGNVINENAITAFLSATSRKLIEGFCCQSYSILPRSFNLMYAQALNLRSRGITHFCLWHSDIFPKTEFWLDKMADLMEANQADVLSVIVPLKENSGLTSTAIDDKSEYRVTRVTLHEAYNEYPPTFTHEKLLLNTGLMLIDIRKQWAEKCYFTFDEKIVKNEKGEFKAVGMSEDWYFSRQALALGAKLYATREIELEHFGNARYPNTHAWGSCLIDT